MVKTLKQKRGTAIRTKFAPPYILRQNYNRQLLEKQNLNRIYGGGILWEHGQEKLKSFIDNINKTYPTIKFTADWSKTSIIFLDVTISITDGIIETDLYMKLTDSHQYLLSSSCHPFYCKKGIPHSQALRLNRICSNYESFDKRCNDLEKYLLERGYSEKMVHKEILQARPIPREG